MKERRVNHLEKKIATKHGVCVVHTEKGITESQEMRTLALYAKFVNEREEKDGSAA